MQLQDSGWCVWGDDVGGSWLAARCLESTKLCGIYCCSWSMPTSNWFYDSPSSQGTSQPITTTNPNNLPPPHLLACRVNSLEAHLWLNVRKKCHTAGS